MLVVALSIAAADEAGFQYAPAESGFPEDSQPAWRRAGPRNAAQIENDALAVTLEKNDILFWVLGLRNEQEQGDAGAWQLDATGNATITFQLKCSSKDPEARAFSLAATGKQAVVWIDFYNDHIQISNFSDRPISHDCEQEDTYRLVISSGKFSLLSKRSGPLAENLAVPKGAEGQYLWFGSTYPFGEHPDPARSSERHWELRFLRWTNQTADFNVPAEEER